MTQEERMEKFNYYVGLTINHLYANFPHGTNCNVSIFVKKEKWWQRLRNAIENEAVSEIAKKVGDMLTDALELT